MVSKIKPVRPNNGKTAHFLAAGGTSLRVGQAIYGGIAQDKTIKTARLSSEVKDCHGMCSST